MNFLSPQSPEFHPPQTKEDPSVSFSEAVSGASLVHDSVPKKYRKLFDTLREDIRSFCKQFNIPLESLRSKEDFGKQLASKIIPSERMAEAVLLFERLEHLVTNREPLKETLPEYLEEAEHLYHLKEQYTAQCHLLKEAGILNEHNAIAGIDGEEYPLPTLEEIAQRLFDHRELLEMKRDQGFTKLLLVPFGMSLRSLRDVFRRFLFDYKKNHKMFGRKIPTRPNNSDRSDWEPLGSLLLVDEKMDTGNSPDIVYHPRSFLKGEQQGETKLQILTRQKRDPDITTPGWKILLLQPSRPLDQTSGIAPIPRENQGKSQGRKNPRHDIETGKTAEHYLSLLLDAQGNQYSHRRGESGMTPEDWILAFMTHLQETGQSLDNPHDGINSSCNLIGSCFLTSSTGGTVLDAGWNPEGALVFLGATARNDPRLNTGTRFVVEI